MKYVNEMTEKTKIFFIESTLKFVPKNKDYLLSKIKKSGCGQKQLLLFVWQNNRIKNGKTHADRNGSELQ